MAFAPSCGILRNYREGAIHVKNQSTLWKTGVLHPGKLHETTPFTTKPNGVEMAKLTPSASRLGEKVSK